MTFNVPNTLSLSRGFLLVLGLYFHYTGNLIASFLLLIVAVLTDFFDGYLARRLNQETPEGAILDPIADKIVGVLAYSYLYYFELVPQWFSVILITRNLSQFMSVPILIWWLKRSFKVKPKFFAKFATAASDAFFFIPLFVTKDIDYLIYPMILIAVFELYVLFTYLPRLIAIALEKHDTFE